MNTKIKTPLLHLCLLLITFLTALFANAQEDTNNRAPSLCRSTWWEYPTIKTNNTIIRDDGNYRVIHSQLFDNASGIYIHTFIIHDYATTNDYMFTTLLDTNNAPDCSVNITDMEIYDNCCFFCGSRDHDALDMGGYQYTEGFVGRFSIPALFFGYNTIEFQTVKDTRVLRSLTVTIPPNNQCRTIVHLVGEMDYWNNYDACLVEVTQPTLTSWNCTVGHLPATPKIYFSDIHRTSSSVVLAAQIKCSTEFPYGYPTYDTNHQQFILDDFTLNGCHADHPVPGHDTMWRYIMDYLDDYCFHDNCVSMKLCGPSLNRFFLAFGVRENDITKSGLRVFSFDAARLNNPLNIYYRTGGSHQVMLDMVSPDHHAPILLSQGAPYKNGIITIPDIDPPQTIVKAFYDDDMCIQSLSLSPTSGFIDVSGKEPAGSILMRFSQKYTAWDQESCFQKTSMERIALPLLLPQKLPVKWEYNYEDAKFEWLSSVIELSQTDENNTCSQCSKNE